MVSGNEAVDKGSNGLPPFNYLPLSSHQQTTLQFPAEVSDCAKQLIFEESEACCLRVVLLKPSKPSTKGGSSKTSHKPYQPHECPTEVQRSSSHLSIVFVTFRNPFTIYLNVFF